jgi:glycosyltransferase involved in cell wall biosynthesis
LSFAGYFNNLHARGHHLVAAGKASYMIWWQRYPTSGSSMLSAIIATRNSERSLVPTLSALVPASASGLLTEVIVADGNSGDATEEVADIAGCRFMASAKPLGFRLKEAAAAARSPWLMFLRAGVIPQPGWIAAADHFIQTSGLAAGGARGAVFRSGALDYGRPGFAGVANLLWAAIGGRCRPEQGLIIARSAYDAAGGHPAGDDAEAALLRRLGRRRLVTPPAAVTVANT